jgi:hypothetical protein
MTLPVNPRSVAPPGCHLDRRERSQFFKLSYGVGDCTAKEILENPHLLDTHQICFRLRTGKGQHVVDRINTLATQEACNMSHPSARNAGGFARIVISQWLQGVETVTN